MPLQFVSRCSGEGVFRISTSSQDAQLQLDALVIAGVQKRDVFADVTSSSANGVVARIGLASTGLPGIARPIS